MFRSALQPADGNGVREVRVGLQRLCAMQEASNVPKYHLVMSCYPLGSTESSCEPCTPHAVQHWYVHWNLHCLFDKATNQLYTWRVVLRSSRLLYCYRLTKDFDKYCINCWSGPRCCSTSLMYAFAQRNDTQVGVRDAKRQVDGDLRAHSRHLHLPSLWRFSPVPMGPRDIYQSHPTTVLFAVCTQGASQSNTLCRSTTGTTS